MAAERERIEAAIEECRRARERLDGDGSFRARVLLDMLMLELAQLLAKLPDAPLS